jgi:hypothetical protein
MLSLKHHATSARYDDAQPGRLFVGDFKGQGHYQVANYGYNCLTGINADVDPELHFYDSEYEL